ncbi:hypothetical protein H4R19_003220 [Coemansia spiralis]|nr:hypothetical protein H4R19_003220 [Coemansia spiralis]
MAQMVVLNLQSLQVLDLADMGMEFLETMVGSDGASISYLQMTKLVMQSVNHNPSQHDTLTTTGCPFPALCHLEITDGYPFSDDTLFRGNYEMLESLDLAYGIQAFKVLNEHLAANGAMLCSLRHLTIIHRRWEVGNDGEVMLAAVAPIIQRAPSLQSLSVFLSDEYHCTFNVVAWLGCIPKQVRMLSVKGKDLNTNEFIMLVRELPSLESLTCGLEFDDETDTSQLGDLSTTNTPISARFRRWNHIINHHGSNRNSDQWNKILAGLCPNFTYRKTENTP